MNRLDTLLKASRQPHALRVREQTQLPSEDFPIVAVTVDPLSADVVETTQAFMRDEIAHIIHHVTSIDTRALIWTLPHRTKDPMCLMTLLMRDPFVYLKLRNTLYQIKSQQVKGKPQQPPTRQEIEERNRRVQRFEAVYRLSYDMSAERQVSIIDAITSWTLPIPDQVATETLEYKYDPVPSPAAKAEQLDMQPCAADGLVLAKAKSRGKDTEFGKTRLIAGRFLVFHDKDVNAVPGCMAFDCRNPKNIAILLAQCEKHNIAGDDLIALKAAYTQQRFNPATHERTLIRMMTELRITYRLDMIARGGEQAKFFKHHPIFHNPELKGQVDVWMIKGDYLAPVVYEG